MNKTINSSKWAFLNSSSQQIIGFLFFGGMTYLLSPEFFGVYAIGLIFSEILCQLVRLGLSANLINRKKNVSVALNNAFYSTLLIGILVSVAFYYSACLLTSYFEISKYLLVIQIMSIIPLIFSLGSVPDAQLQRKFLYKKIAFATFLASLVSCLIAVVVAFTELSELAFAFQKVIYEFIMLIIIWNSIKWRPSFLINTSILKEQLRVGIPLLVAGLTNVAVNKLKDIFIASVLGPAALGLYRLAIKLQDFVVKLTLGPITAIAIPSLARVKKSEFKGTLSSFIKWMAILSFPIFGGLAITSTDLLSVLFKDEWKDSALALQMLCILGALSIYIHMFKPIFSVLERGGILVKLRVMHFFILFALLYTTSKYGVFYIVLSEIIVTIILTSLGLLLLSKALNENYFSLILSMRTAVVSVSLMLFSLFLVDLFVGNYLTYNPFISLVLFSLFGLFTYALSMKFLFHEDYVVILDYIRASKLVLMLKKQF
ncbi:oligosaccharide flippase family protein [Pseudoalteromonas sp. SR41-7]|uniref:oligosaccharide flippase family protein n=1 Tax=Pseudoalteromonas sp. SR41-7 TaxID=2760947 RepID=UPI001601D245|nr:oligosaccharide flippase family protein [Pseudoalteromonas sp. SR41-7]MBB1297219.1 oligosaccharide flippase family protein [Pseudoalteromonas sp. SR41-7]